MRSRKFSLLLCMLFVILQCCAFLNGCENVSSQLSESTANTVSPDAPYELYQQDGKHYLHFTDAFYEEQSSDVNKQILLQCPEFSSIEDMRTRIQTGDIPEKQLRSLYIYNYNENNDPVEIVDLNELRDMVLPDEMILERILWYGSRYSFEFASDAAITGFCGGAYIVTQEEFDAYFQQFYLLDEHQVITSEEQVADRNAKIILYNNFTGEYKSIYYQLQDRTRTISVKEHYTLSHTDTSVVTSDTIPDQIALFVEDEGIQYYIFLLDPVERPSIEWLLSFGLEDVS